MALKWQKIASVTYGGKPYFYVAFTNHGSKRIKYTVVWNRYAKIWDAEIDDGTNPVSTVLGSSKDRKMGLEYANLHNAETEVEA